MTLLSSIGGLLVATAEVLIWGKKKSHNSQTTTLTSGLPTASKKLEAVSVGWQYDFKCLFS